MPLVVRVVQWEIGDVPADVSDPDDRRPQEDDRADDHQVPRERDRHDPQREPGRVDERQRARRRHVDLFPGGSGAAVEVIVEFFAHWMYTSAATKVRANMSSPTMLT